jgi:hypothetical protein
MNPTDYIGTREIKSRFWHIDENGIGKMNKERCSSFDLEMQYTGLKDKNKIELFEGDIVKNMFGNYLIKDIRELGLTNSSTCDAIDYGEFEIIGNIFQNPELLTT